MAVVWDSFVYCTAKDCQLHWVKQPVQISFLLILILQVCEVCYVIVRYRIFFCTKHGHAVLKCTRTPNTHTTENVAYQTNNLVV